MFGRFPGYLELVHIPQGEIAKFIKTNIISPAALYEKFNSGDCCGLACYFKKIEQEISNGV